MYPENITTWATEYISYARFTSHNQDTRITANQYLISGSALIYFHDQYI